MDGGVLANPCEMGLELEAILNDDVLEDHADVEGVVDVELSLHLQNGQDQLHKTVRTQTSRVGLIEVLNGQELLEDQSQGS
jgi:hypothetical protein